jgi:hypothetical protein
MTDFQLWLQKPGNDTFLMEMAPRIGAWFSLMDEGRSITLGDVADDVGIPLHARLDAARRSKVR